MHLETLKVFCDVVETRSFSTAASRNFVTQSAVSQQVRMLEEKYGKQLLERLRGNVQLTPAGEVLYQVGREIVDRYLALEARISERTSVVAGTVRVSTVHSIGLYELSSPMKAFLQQFPDAHLQLGYSRANKIYEDVLDGAIDIGIVAYPAKRPQITVVPFRDDRLVLVCAPGHALGRARRTSVKKLAGETFVGFERDIPTRKETDRILRRFGVDPAYDMEVDNVETIKRAVEIGRGVAILPEPSVAQEVRNGTLAMVALSDETFVRPLGIIHRQGKHFTPAAERFLDLLRAA